MPLQWKLAFKRTTERRQVQPQDGRSDTGADAVVLMVKRSRKTIHTYLASKHYHT